MKKESKDFLLNFGTVVKLKGIINKMMIVGVNQIIKEDDKSYDYCGVALPYGYVSSDKLFVFNNEDIEKVYFKGYDDDDVSEYLDDLLWERRMNSEK